MNKFTRCFSGPKSKVSRDILAILAVAGIITIAATSPFFIINIIKGLTKLKKYPNKKIYDTFYRLREEGLISFYEKNNQIYISLTEKGKKKAGWMKIDDLEIKKPKKWDGKWRILSFDIEEKKRIYREALRGKLIQLGFKLYQKSAWIIPYDCRKEISILKSFFGLNDKEVKLITAEDVGDDKEFRKFYSLT